MIVKRDHRYHFNAVVGGKRLRFAMGLSNLAAAKQLDSRICVALAEGPKSQIWSDLKKVLPPRAFTTLVTSRGVTATPTMQELEKLVYDKLNRRRVLGELANSTYDMYIMMAERFFNWLIQQGVKDFTQVTKQMAEEYLCYRLDQCTEKGGSGKSTRMDGIVMQFVFDQAKESGFLPLSAPKINRSDADTCGAEPYTPQEMDKLAAATDDSTRLMFLMLKHTGMRRSDISAVTWDAINWDTKTLVWQTKKRKTTVTIPIHYELFSALRNERMRTQTSDILSLTPAMIYTRVVKLGKDADVENAFPHRFRDTLAVSILSAGGTIYDVARVLGISVSTADTSYTRFTPQLQERVRELLEVA